MLGLILFLIFLAVFFLLWWVGLVLTESKRKVEARIGIYTGKQQHGQKSEKHSKGSKALDLKGLFRQSSKVFATGSLTKKMEMELAKANIPLRGEEFLMINLILILVPLLILGLFGQWPLAFVFAGIGLVTPRLFINRAKNNRIVKFNDQIGDSLNIMSNSLRAGFSFMQALEMVSKEMPPPISEEFGRTLREINLGTGTEEALANLAKRIESDDLDLVITAVLIQRQVGGNLSEVLDNISHTIRERVRIKGTVKTLTAQGRLSGILIGLLPMVVGGGITLINPGYMGPLFDTSVGWMLIGGALFSQVIGIVFIKNIVDIQL